MAKVASAIRVPRCPATKLESKVSTLRKDCFEAVASIFGVVKGL